MYRSGALVVCLGCGHLGFGGSSPDASVTDAAAGDASAGDAAAGDGSRSADSGAVLGPCIALAISDNFDDGVMSTAWTLLANNPVNVAETGGVLQVTLATAGGAHYGGYDSATTYDLRGHCMFVTYAGVPTAEPLVEMNFAARTAVGSTGLDFHDGTLDPYVNTGTFTSLGGVPYNPAVHKVLLVREDSGTMTYETSVDGVAFTPLASGPTPFDVSAITIALEAGTYGSAPSPGVASYDNFDLP